MAKEKRSEYMLKKEVASVNKAWMEQPSKKTQVENITKLRAR